MESRVGKLEAHRNPGPSLVEASRLSDGELKELLDKGESGGTVETEHYGKIEAGTTTIIGANYPR